MMPNLSICVVAYHNYNNIETIINSIEKHTDSSINKTIYIVDNSNDGNSDDGKQFKNIIDKYPDVVYLNTGENLGFAKGHNYVLNRIGSDYHAIVNPDIVLVEDSFSKIIQFMEDDQSIGMCVPKMVDAEGNMQLAYRKDPTPVDMFIRMFCPNLFPKRYRQHTLQNQDYSQPFQVPFAHGSFLVIRTELFKKLGGFDERFFLYIEDADLCRRVNQISKVMYFPGTEVIHKWEKGSHKNKKLFYYHVKSMYLYFKKWGIS